MPTANQTPKTPSPVATEIKKALTQLGKALGPTDGAYYLGLKRRALAAIKANKPMRLDALRIEIKARRQAGAIDEVLDAILKAAMTLFNALLGEAHRA